MQQLVKVDLFSDCQSVNELELKELIIGLLSLQQVNSNKYTIPIVFSNYVVTFWLFMSYSRFQLFWGVAVGISYGNSRILIGLNSSTE